RIHRRHRIWPAMHRGRHEQRKRRGERVAHRETYLRPLGHTQQWAWQLGLLTRLREGLDGRRRSVRTMGPEAAIVGFERDGQHAIAQHARVFEIWIWLDRGQRSSEGSRAHCEHATEKSECC